MCYSQVTRGFSYMNEESIDDELKCSICAEIFIDPVAISFCKHKFCRSGIEVALKNKPACPLCRHEPISLNELHPVDVNILNILDQLLVKCDTCDQTNIQRGDFHQHITKLCPKVIVTCSAADLKCGWTGLRVQLDDHVINCNFELMRPILGQIVIMTEQIERIQNDNQELKLRVNGLEHRCNQLKMKIKEPWIMPLRSAEIDSNAKWSENGSIVAGGGGNGIRVDQLFYPQGLFLNDEQTLYIADFYNHRIIEWTLGGTSGKVVAGGNGPGNGNDQLNCPTDVIVDKENNCLIICDRENRRVVRWSLQDSTSGETIISNISCNCLTMDENKYVYITDVDNHEVRRWRLGETQEVIVAGGNGEGDRLDQLSYPTFIFVDSDHSVYVSDYNNHRVMKWTENATEGTIVAGGHGAGDSSRHSYYPGGIAVDQWGTVYVVDSELHRVMRWQKGAIEGKLIAGGNGCGVHPNQINRPSGLLFDKRGNLFVSEYGIGRVQKFEIIT